MAWTLRLSETAKRQLRKLDASNSQAILRYLNRMLLETSDPRERGRGLGGNLAGLWRYRVGDYRVICSLEDHQLVVLILQICHRRDGSWITRGHWPAVTAALSSKGTPIGALDTLIAAHALSQQATLVTNNVKAFEQVPGLQLDNWVPSS